MSATFPSPSTTASAAACIPEHSEGSRCKAGRRQLDDSGVVLVLFAGIVTVLLGVAGFALDLTLWYATAHRAQTAADVAAMGGVVFLPGDLVTRQTRAYEVATQNGFTTSADTVVSAVVGDNPAQLRVSVTRRVDNTFVQLLGLNQTTITRTAVAEFAGPVPMGSPANSLGEEPSAFPYDTISAGQGVNGLFWLNLAGPNAAKANGDRFASAVNNNNGAPPGSAAPNASSSEYTPEGYVYTLKLNENMMPGDRVVIEAFDPIMAFVNDTCQTNLSPELQNYIPGGAGAISLGAPTFTTTATPGALAGDTSLPAAEAATPYSATNFLLYDDTRTSPYCTGDQSLGTNGDQAQTTYAIRSPDASVWDPFDNPIVTSAGCAPGTFRAARTTGGYTLANQILPPGHPNYDAARYAYVGDTGTGPWASASEVRQQFRRWYRFCDLDASSFEAGDEIQLQLSTSLRWNGSSLVTQTAYGGHNRFALRATVVRGCGALGSPNTVVPPGCQRGSAVSLFAREALDVYSVRGAADATFFLARVLPGSQGRTLVVNLWDVTDFGGAGNGTIQVVAPPDSNVGAFSNCVSYNSTVDNSVVLASGSLTNRPACLVPFTANQYNSRLLQIRVPIPSTYDCPIATTTACWVRIRFTYPVGATPTDTTTWTVSLDGDPVRLVE